MTDQATTNSLKVLKITQHFQKYMVREVKELNLGVENSMDLISGVLANLTALHIMQQHELDGQDMNYLFTQFGEGVKILIDSYSNVRRS